jgi:hypothetical protein
MIGVGKEGNGVKQGGPPGAETAASGGGGVSAKADTEIDKQNAAARRAGDVRRIH